MLGICGAEAGDYVCSDLGAWLFNESSERASRNASYNLVQSVPSAYRWVEWLQKDVHS